MQSNGGLLFFSFSKYKYVYLIFLQISLLKEEESTRLGLVLSCYRELSCSSKLGCGASSTWTGLLSGGLVRLLFCVQGELLMKG